MAAQTLSGDARLQIADIGRKLYVYACASDSDSDSELWAMVDECYHIAIGGLPDHDYRYEAYLGGDFGTMLKVPYVKNSPRHSSECSEAERR